MTLRLPNSIVSRADALVTSVDQLDKAPMWRISRSFVLRFALLRGLQRLEAQVAAERDGG